MSNKEQLEIYKEELIQSVSLRGSPYSRLVDQQLMSISIDQAYALGQKEGSEETFRRLEACDQGEKK